MSKNVGMGVRKGTVVLFVPTLFGCLLGIPSLYVFSFFFVTFVNRSMQVYKVPFHGTYAVIRTGFVSWAR